MGLLHFFIHFQKHWKVELYVAHVDHMLRGEVSYEDRQFVEQFCKDRNIPVFSTSIPIPELLAKEGGNPKPFAAESATLFCGNHETTSNQ